MENTNDKIIFYLKFAKSKLNKKCKAHQNARSEIEQIIDKLMQTKNKEENK